MKTAPSTSPKKTKPGGPLSRRAVAILKAQLSLAQPSRAAHWVLLIDMKIETKARPNELVGARWDEFDEAGKVWRLPASRGKYGARDIDLSAKAIKILRRLRKLAKPGDDRMFHCFKSVIHVSRHFVEHALKAGLGKIFFHAIGTPDRSDLTVKGSLDRWMAAYVARRAAA